MKVAAIVQARMGSRRLPSKVMKIIGEKPMIELLLMRLSAAQEIDQIVLATTTDKCNLPLIEHTRKLGHTCVVGSENDVLGRYLQAAKQVDADVVVRITGDCPLVDPALVDEAIKKFKSTKVDYMSNTTPSTYPDGLDVEVFTFQALERASQEASKEHDREHVTPYLRQPDLFKIGALVYETDLSGRRWTVDEPEDYQVITNVFEHFKPDINFSWKQVLDLQDTQPSLFLANQHINRNEGENMGSGEKLWKRAKRVIPGGNMLLSKRAEMFLPEKWPAYFSRAKGCQVWDLDGKQYTDMSIMGIGTNILGYGCNEIDDAVRQVIETGNMSTFNCPEEVYLAEKLIELHPWANMARFARTGGEANAVAIRIARAATGRDGVAICGYHGWHDWYLSANLGDEENLAGHLLPGLSPNGVPENLRGTVFPFRYNDYDQLERLINKQNIGVIKMEVVRNEEPKNDFLKKVRKLATENGIVLVFDECTSGFRQTFGGLHKLYDVEPDIAIFGKALGNGYAITAIIGRREVMEAAQSTFISSTFWTERIGPAAALKTLDVMERTESWNGVTETGLEIRKRWLELANHHQLTIGHSGLPSLTGFTFDSKDHLSYKTLITQEMLSKGYLAGTSVYVSTEHTPEVLNDYFDLLDPIFGLIKECEDGRDVDALLKGGVCHAGFKRLN